MHASQSDVEGESKDPDDTQEKRRKNFKTLRSSWIKISVEGDPLRNELTIPAVSPPVAFTSSEHGCCFWFGPSRRLFSGERGTSQEFNDQAGLE